MAASQEEKTPLLSNGSTTVPGPRKERKRSVTISCDVQTTIEDYNPDEIKLRKHITLPVTVAIIIGNVIGSGIFISPVSVTESVGSIGASLIVWLTVGLYCLIQALCYAELGTMIPKAGGDYAYVYYILGPLPAFLCVWMHIVMICTSSNAAIARTAATYLLLPLGMDCYTGLVIALAMLIIVTFAVVNIISTAWGTRVQSIFSAAKVGALVLIILLGIVYLAKGNTKNFQEPFKGTSSDPGLWALAMLDGYFAFKGWELVNTLPEEMINPKRDLPRGIIIGMLTITTIYVLTNTAFFAVLSLDQLLKSEAVALTFSAKMIPQAAWIMSIFVAMSCMGTINGSFLSDTRYLFAAGRFDQVPRMFAMLSFKFYTPILPIIVVCVISMCYTLIPTVSELVEYASLGVQLKIMLSIVALLYLRWSRPDLKRPVKVNIVIVVFTLIFLLALVAFNFYQNPRVTGIGVGLFLLGIPLYFLGNFLKKFETAHNFDDVCTICIQQLLYIVPESRRKRKYTQRIDEMFPRPPTMRKQKFSISKASYVSDKLVL